jgi:hypothetical protein
MFDSKGYYPFFSISYSIFGYLWGEIGPIKRIISPNSLIEGEIGKNLYDKSTG